MTEIAETTDQLNLAALFGQSIQQVTTIIPLFMPHRKSSENQNTVTKSTISAPPTVSIELTDKADRRITIHGVPPIKLAELNHCVLERVLNHVKHAHIEGKFEDSKIKAIFGEKKFSFCVVYLFQHDGDQTLTIDFCISHTDKTPAWINGKTSDSLTLMSENEVNLIMDSFVHQCTQAIQNYTIMVYNHAIEHSIKPDYYSMELPK